MGDAIQKQPIRVVRLLKNKSYPTYQLYAQMASKKTTPQDGLRLAALITLRWLAQRLGDEAPEEFTGLPQPEDYRTVSDECLSSFHMSCGFLIDVVSLPEQGIWSLQITEPDLGSEPGNPNQARPAVPGRVIETNVAFQINRRELDCGFRTVISEPAETPQKAEVYRLAIVKQLVNHPDFGLKQIAPLTAQAKEIANVDQLKRFWELCRNPNNQLPVVVFIEKKQAPINLEDLPKIGEMSEAWLGKLSLPMESKPPAPAAPEPLYDYNGFARHTMAYSRSYLLEESLLERLSGQLREPLSAGDIVLIEPLCFGGKHTVFSPKASQQRREEFLKQLQQDMLVYPREKKVTFGDISFLSAARETLLQSMENLRSQSKGLSLAWQQKIAQMERQWKELLGRKEQEYNGIKDQLKRQKEYNTRLEQEKEALKEQQEDERQTWILDLAQRDDEIVYLRRKLSQPQILRDIPGWVEKNFPHRLILLSVAADMLADKALHADAALICDALDFLATDYWAGRYERISDEEMKTRCSQKYGRPFEIKPIGEMTVNVYPKEYKVKYTFSGENRRREVALDSHLCVGNDAEMLVRIYFFHDDDRKLIVVGSLPRHLSAIKC